LNSEDTLTRAPEGYGLRDSSELYEGSYGL
jgi:hypothetical protein